MGFGLRIRVKFQGKGHRDEGFFSGTRPACEMDPGNIMPYSRVRVEARVRVRVRVKARVRVRVKI
jgi:hypothetical protein